MNIQNKPFDQNLNTNSNVSFNDLALQGSLTTPSINTGTLNANNIVGDAITANNTLDASNTLHSINGALGVGVVPYLYGGDAVLQIHGTTGAQLGLTTDPNNTFGSGGAVIRYDETGSQTYIETFGGTNELNFRPAGILRLTLDPTSGTTITGVCTVTTDLTANTLASTTTVTGDTITATNGLSGNTVTSATTIVGNTVVATTSVSGTTVTGTTSMTTPIMNTTSYINIGAGTTHRGDLSFPATDNFRKITFYTTADNNYQFLGFGQSTAQLTYHVNNTGTDHVFYAGTSASARSQLVAIKGNNTSEFNGPLLVTSNSAGDSANVDAVHINYKTGDAVGLIECINYGSGTSLPLQIGAKTIKLNADKVKLPVAASDPSGTPEAGEIYYNTTTSKVMVYDGTAWSALDWAP